MPAVESQYLEPQSAVVPFVQGLDQKSDPKAVQAPKLLDLKAASFFKPGEISKDRGYPSLNTGQIPFGATSAIANRRIIGCNGRSLMAVDSDLYAYSATDNAMSPVVNKRGLWATTSVETTSHNKDATAGTPAVSDYATANGYELLASANGNAIMNWTIRDRASGQVLYVGSVTISATVRPSAFALSNGYLGLVWLNGATCNCLQWNSNATNISPSTTAVGADATGVLVDAFPSAADTVAIVFQQNASGKLNVTWFNIVSHATTVNQAVTANIDRCLTVTCSATQTFVVWGDSATGVRANGFTSASGANLGGAILDAAALVALGVTAVLTGNGSWAVAYFDATTGGIYVLSSSVAGVTTGHYLQVFGYDSLAHRAVALNTADGHGGFVFGASRQSTVPLLLPESYYTTIFADLSDTNTMMPIAWYLNKGNGGVNISNRLSNCQAVTVNGATEYRWSADERQNVQLSGAAGASLWTYSVAQSIMTFRIGDGSAVPLGQSGVAMPGATAFPTSTIPIHAGVDRTDLQLTSWPYAPEITATSSYNVGGGGLVAASTYSYVAVYEFTDDQGNVMQSAPSLPVQVTIGGGNNAAHITVTTPFARPLAKGSVRLTTVLYRTAAAGTLYKRTLAIGTSNSLDVLASPGQQIIDDTLSDAKLATANAIYTDSGELENSPAPHGRVLVLHQDRAWTIDEHSGELRYTKEIQVGLGLGWHPNLAIDLRNNGINGKALLSTNNGLWVFGTDTITGAGAIQFLVGSGPSDSGLGSSYALQRLEGVTVSCQDQRHCVSTPAGVLFYDPQQGFHLLSAQAAPAFVGAEVQALVSGQVLGMHVMSDRKEVRVTLSTSTLLVWHYDVQQWSQRPVATPGGGESPSVLVDACMWNGRHTLLYADPVGPNPDILQQAASGYTDASSTFYPLSLDTAWIKAASFKGLQRIWRITLLGRSVTNGEDATAQASLWFDYDDASSAQVLNWSAAEVSAATNPAGVISLAIVPNKQLCESFKLRLEDTNPDVMAGTYFGGIAWTAMRIDYGVRRGRARQGDAAVRG